MYYNKLKASFIAAIVLLTATQLCVAAPIKVVAITTDFASIAKSVGGSLVETQTLVRGSRNLHDIQAKPSMVMKVKDADLLIRLGMKQDSWIDGLIQVSKNGNLFPGKPGYLDASNRIRKLEVPTGKLDGSHGDVHKHGNPHYWLNPENGHIIAEQIRDHLSILDPKNKDIYHNNCREFSKKLTEKTIVWKKQLTALKEFRFITYHKIWPYFFEAFELNSIGELEPLPGIPPTSKHLYTLKKHAKDIKKDIVVLSANFYPEHTGKSFAKSIGAQFKSTPINSGEEAMHTYFDLFDFLVKELTQ